MAFVCEQVVNNVCIAWVEHSHTFLPNLSTADRDALLLFFVSVLSAVFVVKMIRRLLYV